MQKENTVFKSPHIIIALVTAASIIIMTIFSKKILKEPIGFVELAIPPFIATIFSLIFKKIEETELGKIKYWIIAILVSTLIILFIHI